MPRTALPRLAALALTMAALPAAAEETPRGLKARWLGAEVRSAPAGGVAPAQPASPRVVVTVELINHDATRLPVKPFPIRLLVGGRRVADVEVDIGRARVSKSSTQRPAPGPFDFELAPGETARVEVVSRPLPPGHPAAAGRGEAVLELTSPRTPRITLRGPLAPAAAPVAPSAPPEPRPVARPGGPAPWPAADFQRGVVYSSWDGTYPHPERWRADLDHFRALGVTWLEVLTFAEQPQVNAPVIRRMPPARWPKAFVTEARARGFRVLVKPHVWSREFYDGSNRWRGSIAMADADAWKLWFAAYGDFIEFEARMAAEVGAEMFSIGLEYVEATKGYTAEWQALIARVRAVYPGILTYAADGNHEARHIGFWGDLDVIGIDAYFDIGAPALPGGADLELGWMPHVAWMKALSEQHGKPIVFTEAGYPSIVGATRQPWKWHAGHEQIDDALQARAYDALMRVCTAGGWCRGVFWWKYYEMPERGTSHAHDYSPRGKPAEAVLRRWYTTPAP